MSIHTKLKQRNFTVAGLKFAGFESSYRRSDAHRTLQHKERGDARERGLRNERRLGEHLRMVLKPGGGRRHREGREGWHPSQPRLDVAEGLVHEGDHFSEDAAAVGQLQLEAVARRVKMSANWAAMLARSCALSSALSVRPNCCAPSIRPATRIASRRGPHWSELAPELAELSALAELATRRWASATRRCLRRREEEVAGASDHVVYAFKDGLITVSFPSLIYP